MESKYSKWYFSLMSRAAVRETDGYSERHHIIPVSLGGTDEKSNIVTLTYREHFLAHWLLVRMHEGSSKRKMLHALHMMCRGNKEFTARICASWQFDVARRAARDARLGRKHTAEAKERMSRSLQGRTLTPEQHERLRASMIGRKVSEEAKIKIGNANRNRPKSEKNIERLREVNLGKVHSEDTKRKISEALSGRKLSAEHVAQMRGRKLPRKNASVSI